MEIKEKVLLGIGIFIFGLGVAWSVVKQTSEQNKQTVEKHTKQIYEIKELDVRQSMIMERNTHLIDKLEKKL